MQLSSVLGHSAVPGLDKFKLALDDSERVLDFGKDSGFERLKLIGDAIFGRASIGKDGVLFSGEKFFNGVEVVHIGTRRLKTPASFYS